MAELARSDLNAGIIEFVRIRLPASFDRCLQPVNLHESA